MCAGSLSARRSGRCPAAAPSYAHAPCLTTPHPPASALAGTASALKLELGRCSLGGRGLAWPVWSLPTNKTSPLPRSRLLAAAYSIASCRFSPSVISHRPSAAASPGCHRSRLSTITLHHHQHRQRRGRRGRRGRLSPSPCQLATRSADAIAGPGALFVARRLFPFSPIIALSGRRRWLLLY